MRYVILSIKRLLYCIVLYVSDVFVAGWDMGLGPRSPHRTKRANHQPHRAARTEQNTRHYDHQGSERMNIFLSELLLTFYLAVYVNENMLDINRKRYT